MHIAAFVTLSKSCHLNLTKGQAETPSLAAKRSCENQCAGSSHSERLSPRKRNEDRHTEPALPRARTARALGLPG